MINRISYSIIYISVIFLFISFSCVNNSEIELSSKANNKSKTDTLYIEENTFRDTQTGENFVTSEYSYIGHSAPKSENIKLTFTYSKTAKYILENSKVLLKPKSKDVLITSLSGNNKFNIYIKDSYKDSIFIFDFLITPNNNFVYIIKYKSFSKYIDTIYISQHLRYVEQK